MLKIPSIVEMLSVISIAFLATIIVVVALTAIAGRIVAARRNPPTAPAYIADETPVAPLPFPGQRSGTHDSHPDPVSTR